MITDQAALRMLKIAAECCRDGCGDPGVWVPVLLFYAPAACQNETPLEMPVGITVCDRHRLDFDVDELAVQLEPVVAAVCKTRRLVEPDYELTDVEFLPHPQTQPLN